MWKLMVVFVAFAAVALWFIAKGGDSVDMSGEQHGVQSTAHSPPATATTPK